MYRKRRNIVGGRRTLANRNSLRRRSRRRMVAGPSEGLNPEDAFYKTNRGHQEELAELEGRFGTFYEKLGEVIDRVEATGFSIESYEEFIRDANDTLARLQGMVNLMDINIGNQNTLHDSHQRYLNRG